jgi:hypothetical protein
LDVQINNIRIQYYPDIDSSEFRIISGLPQTIYPGESKKILINFKPKYTGERTSDLIINSDIDTNDVIVKLKGYCSPQSLISDDDDCNIIINLSHNNIYNNYIISLYSDCIQYLEIDIYNSLGIKIQNIANILEKGRNDFYFQYDVNPSGVYFCIIRSKNNILIKKFFVIR